MNPARLRSLTDPDRLFTVVRLVAFATWLWLGRDLTFMGDEWDWIHYRTDWTMTTFMSPHGEHWSLGLALLYKPLLATVGLRSYLPYLGLLLLLHLSTASALMRFTRVQAGPWAGLAGASLFLFLGRAGEDLFWAFQIGFVGATCLGTWALILLLEGEGRTHRFLIGALLLGAVATAGIGLPFLAASALAVLLRADRVRNLRLLLPATFVYGAWHALIGSRVISGPLAPFTEWADFIRIGVSTAAAALAGTTSRAGLLVVCALSLAALAEMGRMRRFPDKPPPTGLLCGLAGLFTQFALIGSVRAQFGASQATASRYVYTACAFLIVAVASWAGARKESPVRMEKLAIAALFLYALRANLDDLSTLRAHIANQAMETRAAVALILDHGGAPGLPADLGMSVGGPRYITPARSGTRAVIPGSDELRRIVAAMGSPLSDAFFPSLGEVSPSVRDRILFRVVGDPIVTSSVDQLPLARRAPGLWPGAASSFEDGPNERSDGCLTLKSASPGARAYVTMPPASSLYVRSTLSGPMKVSLSRWGTFSDEASVDARLTAAAVTRIDLPIFNPGGPWILAVSPVVGAATALCGGVEASE